ncbi:malate dehydrogenase, partial [Candidatus Beckwithbacteria bacterium CG23_combo_of_CG06-09_8_20_14_all_47_9]
QVNNLLCFPYIFKGAFTAKVSQITPKMKLAAVKALAALVKNPTPDCILPNPFDPRLKL